MRGDPGTARDNPLGSGGMTVTHRIALDPTDRQDTILRRHAGYARVAWNWGVAESRRALEAGEKGATSQYRLRPLWNRVKRDLFPWCGEHSQNCAKYALIDLGEAWRRCFRTKGLPQAQRVRRPRFHSRKHGMAFRADNGPGAVRYTDGRLRLPKIGALRVRERPRFGGPIRECTVKHDGRRWYACCVYARPAAEPKTEGPVVGVDVGLRRLATTYDGETFGVHENPRPLRHALRRLRRLNRRISRSRTIHGKTRCSNRRLRRYSDLRRQHSRVAAVRRDSAHKATTAIAKSASVVCVESLNVRGWMASRSLARATADASPGLFLDLLRWKCRREGVHLVEADRWYPSSKICSGCGEKNAALGREARWCCPGCGVDHDRDENAAINLRRQGLPSLGVEAAEDLVRQAAAREAPTGQAALRRAGLS